MCFLLKYENMQNLTIYDSILRFTIPTTFNDPTQDLDFNNLECDLDWVIKHEPWTYGKHLVTFEMVVANVPISALAFQFTSFWIQIHNLPIHYLNRETQGEIGSLLGTFLHMTDLESDRGKGNYLRGRVRIDITKPLNKVRKIWSEGSVIGCVVLKYEHLPNFCYWCGLVSHDDKDCERWLRSKGSLEKSDQHYRDWIRAEVNLQTKKNIHHSPQIQTEIP